MTAAAFPKRRMVVILLAVVAALALLLLIPILTDPYGGELAPGTKIGGEDFSGLTKREARAALESALDRVLLTKELKISLPKETVTLSPEQVVKEVDVKQAVADAYRNGRADAPGTGNTGLLTYVTVNEEAIRSALEGYAAKYDTEFSQMEYHLEGEKPVLSTDGFDETVPCQTLVITLGVPEVKLNVDAVYEEICSVIDSALVCQPKDYQVKIGKIMPLQYPDVPDMAAIFEELTVEAVDDSLDLQTYQLVPGTYGYTFDKIQAGYRVATSKPGSVIEIPMEYVTPAILGDGVYFRDVLGHCETKHNTDENRNTNLRLLCQTLDGYVIQPGEEFSYNGVLGERTEEKGYKPATAYSGTRMVKDIGGGVCQGSTTLYNCALLADLEILERVCHGATVTYIPIGLDAAVNWNTKTDLRFRNNFHFPMMIKAEVSDGYVRMKLLGTDEKDYYIKMTSGYGEQTETVTYAVSYKNKYDKQTNELISKDREAFSAYYPLK